MEPKDTEGLMFPKNQTRKRRMFHPASILNSQKGMCFLCHRVGQTEEHHIFGGPNRKNSEKYGLKVDLCPACHRTGRNSAHNGKMVPACLHEMGQRAFETKVGSREQFVEIFGKNYIEV